MKAYKIMFQTELLIWLHNFKPIIGRLVKSPYIYNMKVKFKDDNSVVEVKDFKDIVTFMRKNASFIKAQNNHEYMIGYAKRAVISKDQDIIATDETSFVNDLIKYNHIEIIENNLN